MANNDRIYEAYKGFLGENFQKSTQKRINWILNKASACQKILDVGCSQGIISLLLAESGKNVTGIDIQQESIDFALGLLNTEYTSVSNRIIFLCMDFLDFHSSEKYDCIIITEVLEHMEEPGLILEKASSLLKPEGKCIISTPFGLCPHPDHRKTYYVSNFTSLLQSYFCIKELEFIENWIGANCDFSTNNDIVESSYYYPLEEKVFLEKEKHYVETIQKCRENLQQIDQKYQFSLQNYETSKEWNASLNEALKATNEKYKKALANYNTMKIWHENGIKENEKLKSELEEQRTLLEKMEEQLSGCFQDYDFSIARMEQLSRMLTRLEIQNSTLAQKNNEQKAILDKIDHNFFGRLAIKLYHLYQRYFQK